jgi:hypothetical protein
MAADRLMGAVFSPRNQGVRLEPISFPGEIESINRHIGISINLTAGPVDFNQVRLPPVSHPDLDPQVVA